MAQPQPPIPQRGYSPHTQFPSQSPVPPPTNLPTEPPIKRQRMSPNPSSQPQSPSPFSPSTLAVSPGAAMSPSAPSPSYANMGGAVPPTQPASYAVANTGLHLPSTGISSAPTTPAPLTPVASTPQYTTAQMLPLPNSSLLPDANTMPPPSKPADKPTKEYDYDVSDSLAGTGIDIRAEEAFMAEMYGGRFGAEARTGFPLNAPGSRSMLYGAGNASQPPQPVAASNQDQLAAQSAEKAWHEAAARLAVTRSTELMDPFLQASTVHARAEKIAREYGVSLNLDQKNPPLPGKMRTPLDFPRPSVTVSTKRTADGMMVSTSGSFIPHDAYLADQLALLTISTKRLLREKLEELRSTAVVRQQSSQGQIPAEWADVAAPLSAVDGAQTSAPWETPTSPRANPLKRSADPIAAKSASQDGKTTTTNHLAVSMREGGKTERDLEEARLRKRQRRLNPESVPAASRSNSVAPGTPGSIAPEVESKAPTKKEQKRGALAAKLAEASSTASANQTLAQFMGRKKGKSYSWMTAGNSGASTPSRAAAQDTPGTPTAAATAGPKVPEKVSLTQDGRYRLGSWREDGEKGKNMQLRDWVMVLERDGKWPRVVQDAYLKLDMSNPK